MASTLHLDASDMPSHAQVCNAQTATSYDLAFMNNSLCQTHVGYVCHQVTVKAQAINYIFA